MLFSALMAVDIALALKTLYEIAKVGGLTGALKGLLRLLGPLAIAILVITVAIEIVSAITKTMAQTEKHNARLARLYRESECDRKADIFRKKGLPIPQ